MCGGGGGGCGGEGGRGLSGIGKKGSLLKRGEWNFTSKGKKKEKGILHLNAQEKRSFPFSTGGGMAFVESRKKKGSALCRVCPIKKILPTWYI